MEIVTRTKIQKMKKLILTEKTQLVDPEVLTLKHFNQQAKVNFGIAKICRYSKHSRTQVKGVLYNPNTKAYISYNEKQIHVWAELTGASLFKVDFFQETKSHQIACMCYSAQHMLYLVLATDFKLHVFNENLIHVDGIASKTRLVH